MAEKIEETIDETAETTELESKPIPEIDSKYRMIILAAQRSKQLQRGAVPRVDADLKKQKSTRIAMKELAGKKIHFDILTEEITK